VDEAELSLRRSQMGHSARSFLVAGNRAVQDQGPGYWVALSGAPSPDANMALVDTGDSGVLAAVVRRIEDAGLPTLIILAGAGRGAQPGTGWQHVGDMPFMAFALDGARLHPDGRVRQARVDDFGVVSDLVASSFGLIPEVAAVVAGILELGDAAGKLWLLVEGAQAVSTVLTSIVDDAVCVWCMGTPPRFARHGYGRSLLTDVLLRARLEGAGIGLLGATPAGKPLYDATGWTTLEQWQLYLNPEPVHENR
jgi:GNAT superfamily N-acetyltransferase